MEEMCIALAAGHHVTAELQKVTRTGNNSPEAHTDYRKGLPL
jgi:hypothetical protein